ncbi:MAG: nucleotidyltransferase family protein [Candidatus Omnitrophica bacterium]|nr:nucleotidyltransferase family protein [Candidatus Omnitrophota bacterium]MCM8826699.1 nucleotidyltransferase family protein [Candidatus Omnitrophota bacterium]
MNAERKFINFIIDRITNHNIDEDIKELPFSHIDWNVFKNLVFYHELAPFVYLVSKDYGSFIPKDLFWLLKQCYYCAVVHCENLMREFLFIDKIFKDNQILAIPLKGIALLFDLYSQIPLRPMLDIDILVKEEYFPKAEKIIMDMGYSKDLHGLTEKYWREKQCHLAFRKLDKVVELHWDIDYKKDNLSILPLLWKRIRKVRTDSIDVNLLSCEDTFLSLALHQRRFGKALCLKNVIDAILLLHKYNASFDWDYVVKVSKMKNIQHTIFFLLAQMEVVSENSLYKLIMKDLNISPLKRYLIQKLIEKNTFSPFLNSRIKSLYLKSHFLLYDNFIFPIKYILGIPKEQFAAYFDLEIDAKSTHLFYRNRLFYMPFKFILDNISKQLK